MSPCCWMRSRRVDRGGISQSARDRSVPADMLRAVVLNRAAPSERDIVRAYIRRASIGWGPEPRGRASSRALSLWPMPVGPQREKKAPTKRI
eukprot:scaffold234637_cov28-Tisochrysis_lutea.AAC.1